VVAWAASSTLGILALVALAQGSTSPDPQASPSAATLPKSLEACYLQVALAKSNADVLALAKGICDDLFKPQPRSVILRDPASRMCVEQWFDRNGRYETADQYCAFEPYRQGEWTYACESKPGGKHLGYTVVPLREEGNAYLRQGKPSGYDPGPLFKSLAACLKARGEN
jgi:hypothetical protein